MRIVRSDPTMDAEREEVFRRFVHRADVLLTVRIEDGDPEPRVHDMLKVSNGEWCVVADEPWKKGDQRRFHVGRGMGSKAAEGVLKDPMTITVFRQQESEPSKANPQPWPAGQW